MGIIEQLLDGGAAVDGVDNGNATALMAAASYWPGHLDAVKLLVRRCPRRAAQLARS